MTKSEAIAAQDALAVQIIANQAAETALLADRAALVAALLADDTEPALITPAITAIDDQLAVFQALKIEYLSLDAISERMADSWG